jgi:hypothetical protein
MLSRQPFLRSSPLAPFSAPYPDRRRPMPFATCSSNPLHRCARPLRSVFIRGARSTSITTPLARFLLRATARYKCRTKLIADNNSLGAWRGNAPNDVSFFVQITPWSEHDATFHPIGEATAQLIHNGRRRRRILLHHSKRGSLYALGATEIAKRVQSEPPGTTVG